MAAQVGAIVYSFKADIENLKRGMAQVRGQLGEVSRQAQSASREMQRGMDNATGSARKLTNQFSTLQLSIASFASRMTATLVRELPQAIAQATENLRELQETARTLGVSFGSLQNLNKAGSALGFDPKAMNADLREFALRLSEAARDGGKLAEFMKANGIALKDASGAARPFKDVFADVARLIANSRSEVDKLNAIKLLGLSEEMQRVFEQAGGDVRKFAEDAGGEMNEFQKTTLARYQELKADFQKIWQSISDNVINYLAEIKRWALEAAEAVATAFRDVARGIEAAIASGKRALGMAAEAVGLGGKVGTSDFEYRQEALQIGRKKLLDMRAAAERETERNKRTLPTITVGGASGSIAFPANAEHAHKAARETMHKHKEKVQELTEAQKLLNKAVKEFSNDMASALADIAINGKKAKDVLADLARQLASSGIKSALSGGKGGGLLGGLLGAGASALGGILGFGAKSPGTFSSPLFSGAPFKFMADGGTLGAGKWGIAGEAGPELIQGPATVTPFDKMGGSPNVVIQNFAPGIDIQHQVTPQGVVLTVQSMLKDFSKQMPGMLADAQRRRN
ncbi:hypothetical protein HUN39_17700 [Methylocystis sp. FS]|uniref:hypothetical protein n=1 Tax=Methylocystis silviterrae TaxID=2743612 RepID=UPI0015830A5E|nr:hypothetical protein [Methylocystis silviterrae]NUJ81823.1 hypothetical protein [Methylocystis silviterrae]